MTNTKNIIEQKAIFGWLAFGTFLVLLVPAVAAQFTQAVQWGASDFIVMGLLIFGSGCLFIVLARKISPKYWFGVAALVILALVYVWAELAVGIFTDIGS
ncbi:hypothetical protein [Glaciecola petra]|uniref:Integron gene cassette protein n=1 Tax=Glaciecola petra TaxID=3075602 RepID=A0ABU2ZWE9_9ALTE|nr:hypothetical protein [Aestuariibacter sp. P117]MDT0596634.1 hypothetical protein [Aestuariibacter sp. P117]